MVQKLKAIYHNGVFIPQVPFDLPEDTEVELTIYDPYTVPPKVKDPEERKRILKQMVERMKNNPIPANVPRFTLDELHERR